MRVLLFGVDGLTFRILNPMIERGLLPNFQRVRDGGAQGVLKSIVPPLTSPAWTSISTGLPPAKHGVYDFWEYEHTEQGPRPHVVTHRKGGKAIWNTLSEWGKHVIVANIPITYPPEPVSGIMLSGYMSPDMNANVTYPTSFKDELLQAVPDYQIDLNPAVQNLEHGDILEETLKMTRERISMMRLLLSKPWDFFFIAFVGADRIQHHRWDEIVSFHPQAVAYYQMLDEALGMALDALKPEDMLMIVSDHGFQGVRRKFYIHEYLYKLGLLKVKNDAVHRRTKYIELAKLMLRKLKLQWLTRPAGKLARQLLHKKPASDEPGLDAHAPRLPDLDWVHSHAWIPSTSGWLGGYADIYFDETVTEEQINDLKLALETMRDPKTGQPLAIEVHREDAFGSGPYVPSERHLVVIAGENINMHTRLGRVALWETTGWSMGTHHPEGVVYLYGAGVKKGVSIAPTHIYDIVPTILSFMAMPLAEDLAGNIMAEAFETPVPTSSAAHESDAESNSLVMRKLKKLASRSAKDLQPL